MRRTYVKSPVATPKSRTSSATQWPGPAGTPPATTPSPAGAWMVASKSAIGEEEVSPFASVGGCSAQPTPGSQGSSGKNEPSRIAVPFCEIRSLARCGRVSRNGSEACTVAPAAIVLGTTSVVGSARCEAAVAPSTVTGPATMSAPSRRSTGPFAHSRNTRRSVAMSGVNATATVPCTRWAAGSMVSCSV